MERITSGTKRFGRGRDAEGKKFGTRGTTWEVRAGKKTKLQHKPGPKKKGGDFLGEVTERGSGKGKKKKKKERRRREEDCVMESRFLWSKEKKKKKKRGDRKKEIKKKAKRTRTNKKAFRDPGITTKKEKDEKRGKCEKNFGLEKKTEKRPLTSWGGKRDQKAPQWTYSPKKKTKSGCSEERVQQKNANPHHKGQKKRV